MSAQETIDLSDKVKLPARTAVVQRYAFVAKSGAGKTYSAGVLVEELIRVGAQVVILDPVGNWYGLRLGADGKKAGLPIPVVGGLQGDLDLTEDRGELLADLVVEKRASMVLDVSMLRKAARLRFAADFLERLFEKKKGQRSPMHLVIEEAQTIAPQVIRPEAARLAGAAEDVIKLGRNFGIGVSLITQRPQAVSKEALNQTEVLVALQTNGTHERKAIKDWVVEVGGEARDFVSLLPGLGLGEAFVWSPSWLRVLERVKVNRKRTFNASSTPELGGDEGPAPTLSPVDLEQLRAAMEETEAARKADDPKLLRKQIRELEGQIAELTSQRDEAVLGSMDAAGAVADREALEDAIAGGRKVAAQLFAGELNRLEAALANAGGAFSGLRQIRLQVLEQFEGAAKNLGPAPEPLRVDLGDLSANEVRAARAKLQAATTGAVRVTPISNAGHVKIEKVAPIDDVRAGELGAGETRMLRVLGQVGAPLEKNAVAILSGYSPDTGTVRRYFSTLRSENLVEDVGTSKLCLTSRGIDVFQKLNPARITTDQVLALQLGALGGTERKMLQALLKVAPDAMDRAALGAMVGIRADTGTFRRYQSTLSSRGLIEKDADGVKASDVLFTFDRR